MSLNQKQSTDKQKDGEQTPHAAKVCMRGSSNRLIPLTAEETSGGGYEPRRIHKQELMFFMVFIVDVCYFTNLTNFVNVEIAFEYCHPRRS